MVVNPHVPFSFDAETERFMLAYGVEDSMALVRRLHPDPAWMLAQPLIRAHYDWMRAGRHVYAVDPVVMAQAAERAAFGVDLPRLTLPAPCVAVALDQPTPLPRKGFMLWGFYLLQTEEGVGVVSITEDQPIYPGDPGPGGYWVLKPGEHIGGVDGEALAAVLAVALCDQRVGRVIPWKSGGSFLAQRAATKRSAVRRRLVWEGKGPALLATRRVMVEPPQTATIASSSPHPTQDTTTRLEGAGDGGQRPRGPVVVHAVDGYQGHRWMLESSIPIEQREGAILQAIDQGRVKERDDGALLILMPTPIRAHVRGSKASRQGIALEKIASKAR